MSRMNTKHIETQFFYETNEGNISFEICFTFTLEISINIINYLFGLFWGDDEILMKF